MPNKPYSLRRKLLTWLLLPLLILLSLRAGYTYYYSNQLSSRVYDRMLFTLTLALSQQITYDSVNRQIRLTDAAVRLLLSDELDALYFSVRNAQGKVIAGERTLPPLPADQARNEQPFFDGRIGVNDIRIAFIPLTFEHEAYLLEVAETLNKRKLLSREVQVGSLIPQALIIFLTTIIVWFGVGKSLSPLERLKKAISERSHVDLSPVHEAEISAEVLPLINSINDLMARLSAVLEVQNRFIADAAHQLRTPLAGLKSQIELALRQNDETKISETIHSLLASTDRMTRLVNQLLALARNEPNAEGALNKQPLDLASLASTITMEWVPQALEKDIDLGFEAPKHSVAILGDAARIKDLIDNLIDNAVRYSPQHGRITVSVIDTPRPTLIVTDTGPGIPPELRERVFERFYRLLGNSADGSGLGLAIVREIARMHGADARIDVGTGGIGTGVYIAF